MEEQRRLEEVRRVGEIQRLEQQQRQQEIARQTEERQRMEAAQQEQNTHRREGGMPFEQQRHREAEMAFEQQRHREAEMVLEQQRRREAELIFRQQEAERRRQAEYQAVLQEQQYVREQQQRNFMQHQQYLQELQHRLENSFPNNASTMSSFLNTNNPALLTHNPPNFPQVFQNFAQPQPQVLLPSFRTKSETIAKWGVTFSGDEKSNLQTFLQDIESQAKTEGCSREELRRAAFYLFTGPARKWYQAFGDEYPTWQELVEELKLYYLSPNNDSRVRRYIDSRRQKRFEPFMAYLADMELNFKRLSYEVSESEKVQTMKDNLNPYFAEKMVLMEVTTMKDFKRFGRQIELLSMTHRGERINLIDEDRPEGIDSEEIMAIKGQTNKISKTVGSTQTEATQTSSGRSSMKCFNCDTYGHHHNQCPEPKTRPFCYKCGEKESTTTNCTNCASGNEYSGAEGGATSRH
jgi:hypothetical protein